MILTKDGITVEVDHPAEIARLKAAGYKEVKDNPNISEVKATPTEEVAPEKTPEEQNAEAIIEANKPIGSKKGKGKS